MFYLIINFRDFLRTSILNLGQKKVAKLGKAPAFWSIPQVLWFIGNRRYKHSGKVHRCETQAFTRLQEFQNLLPVK